MGLIFDADKDKAEHYCKKLVEIMQEDFLLSSGNVHITISVGAAVFPSDTDNPLFLQSYADAALYETKKKGRDGYQLFNPALMENIGKK